VAKRFTLLHLLTSCFSLSNLCLKQQVTGAKASFSGSHNDLAVEIDYTYRSRKHQDHLHYYSSTEK